MLLEDFKRKSLGRGTHMIVEERNGMIEAFHRAHVAVVDRDGVLLHSSGDPHLITYSRSCMKPIQAVPLVSSGAADHYSLSPQEVAIVSGSHSGQEGHIAAVRSILSKAGLSEDLLRCGGHAPFHAETSKALSGRFQPIHDNCSGKHAGVLALSKFKGWPLENYLDLDHPSQAEVLSTIMALTGLEREDIHLGTDGCGLPNQALPLDRMARMFALLADPGGHPLAGPLGKIRDCMMANPFHVAGSDRFDTAFMQDHPNDAVSKGGAVGLQSIAIRTNDRWLGICLKVEDGSYPAVAALAYHVSEELGLPPGKGLGEKFRHPEVRTRADRAVGSIRVFGRLRPLR